MPWDKDHENACGVHRKTRGKIKKEVCCWGLTFDESCRALPKSQWFPILPEPQERRAAFQQWAETTWPEAKEDHQVDRLGLSGWAGLLVYGSVMSHCFLFGI